LIPGPGFASEPAWVACTTPQFSIGTSYYRYAVMNDPDWNPAELDLDTDLDRAQGIDAGAIEAMDPVLSAVIRRGGKLVIYHGTTDSLVPHEKTVNYVANITEALGEDTVADSMRLYLVPGMDHCGGGEGAFAIDWLCALEGWAEDDEAPGALRATHPPIAPPGTPRAAAQAFTRPVCPYPQVARYLGSGDDTDAANFACTEPQAR
jgi:feruloyl esterase